MEFNGTTSSAPSAFKDSKMLKTFEGVSVKSANRNQLTPFHPLMAPVSSRQSYTTLTDDISFVQNPITEINLCSSQSSLYERYPKDFCADSPQASPKFDGRIAEEEIPKNAVSSSRPADIALTIETMTALKKNDASARCSVYNKWSSVWDRFRRVFIAKKSKMGEIHESEEVGMVAINMEEEEEHLSESDESVYFDESSDSDDYKWERITKFSQMKDFLRHRRS